MALLVKSPLRVKSTLRAKSTLRVKLALRVKLTLRVKLALRDTAAALGTPCQKPSKPMVFLKFLDHAASLSLEASYAKRKFAAGEGPAGQVCT